MKKLICISLCAVLIGVGFAAGCAKTKDKQQVVETGKVSEDKSKDSLGSKVDEGKRDAEDTANKESNVTVSGVYSGQIDNNSIEILIEGTPTAFFLSDTLKSSFNPKAFKKGNKVGIQYEKNANGQLILEIIEVR